MKRVFFLIALIALVYGSWNCDKKSQNNEISKKPSFNWSITKKDSFPILNPFDSLNGELIVKVSGDDDPQEIPKVDARRHIENSKDKLGSYYSNRFDGFFCSYTSFTKATNYYKDSLKAPSSSEYPFYNAIRVFPAFDSDKEIFYFVFKGEVVIKNNNRNTSTHFTYVVDDSLDFYFLNLDLFRLQKNDEKYNGVIFTKTKLDEDIKAFQKKFNEDAEKNDIPQILFEGESIPIKSYEKLIENWKNVYPKHRPDEINRFNCIHFSPALMEDTYEKHNFYLVLRDGVCNGKSGWYYGDKLWYNTMDACKDNCP